MYIFHFMRFSASSFKHYCLFMSRCVNLVLTENIKLSNRFIWEKQYKLK